MVKKNILKHFRTLDSYDFNSKTVLLRSDLNSDIVDDKVILSERIKESAITIKELLKKRARVVVIAHQGNPGKKDFISLEQHSKFLNKYVKIKFVKDIIGENAIKEIKELKPGNAILLENIRFIDDELNPKDNNVLLKTLAGVCDIYVNDAFSVCHRDHTSITGFPRLLKGFIGRLLEKEIKALEKISTKDCLYILGGAKPEENIKLLTGKKVLACGLFGQLCLVAQGKSLGYQDKYLKENTLVKEDYNVFLDKLSKKLNNVKTPADFAVNYNNERKEFKLSEFPLDYEIEDIGESTIKEYVSIIKKAKAIYMKGPAGNTSDKKYCLGTYKILKAVSECKGFSLIGGGHLSDAIMSSGIKLSKFSHISLSGGALLSYVSGENLVGLEALKK